MSDDFRKLLAIASLYEQVARAIYEDRGPNALHPAQWSALRFFGRAGGEARTVTGLARFLGVTLGPASRAASSLERRGLIASKRNPADGRSVLFDLTPLGAENLRNDPLQRLATALKRLNDDELEDFQRVVTQLLRDMS